MGAENWLVPWPYKNLPSWNGALAAWPAVAWAFKPTLAHSIKYLLPVTGLEQRLQPIRLVERDQGVFD
jgi:hypothetical protein